ncbi:phosphatase PAP2 family protein [Candidatus Gottesmanbacteria bacterium]|nr:phosphatase PAP2 family protein [Candidatus Gottesmanbacteria bacterium]
MIPTIISRIFDPFAVLFIVFVIIMWGTPVFLPALLGMVVLPLVLFIVAWKTKFVSNWDITDRRERPKILWTLVIIEAVGTIAFHLWPVVPILVSLVGFAIVTQFWKISGHAMAAAFATGTVIAQFGWDFWPVLLIVPLVAWARVVRRDHTVAQVVVGALYAWIFLILFNSFV